MAHHGFDAGRSLFTVQAFATGLLSFAAHSPTFAVRDFRGGLEFDPIRPDDASVELIIPAERLELIDRVRPADRRDVESRMRGEVLRVTSFPEIAYRSRVIRATNVAPGRFSLLIEGELSLRGVTRPHPIRAELRTLEATARLVGSSDLRLSEHGIAPVTALAGAIRLKDGLAVSFDLISDQEAP